MSQEELADLSGVQRNYIANLERGAILIPRDPENLGQLAKALGVRLRDLGEPTGWYAGVDAAVDWEAALLADPRFTDEEKQAILTLGRAALRAKEQAS